MENSRWLGVITVGLVIAALAVGYFLLTGKLSTKSTNSRVVPSPTILGQNAQINPTLTPVPDSTSAYNRIIDRSKSQVQTLPKTGFPVGLAVIFSASAMISGWGLRKFPK